jgi:hypothetical protein
MDVRIDSAYTAVEAALSRPVGSIPRPRSMVVEVVLRHRPPPDVLQARPWTPAMQAVPRAQLQCFLLCEYAIAVQPAWHILPRAGDVPYAVTSAISRLQQELFRAAAGGEGPGSSGRGVVPGRGRGRGLGRGLGRGRGGGGARDDHMDPTQMSDAQLRSLAMHLFTVSPAARAFVAGAAAALAAGVAPAARVPLAGDVLTYRVEAYGLPSKPGVVTPGPRVPERPQEASPLSLLHALASRPSYPGRAKADDVHADGIHVEVKSVRFMRSTVEDQVRQVQARERLVLAAASHLCPAGMGPPRILPGSGYARLLTVPTAADLPWSFAPVPEPEYAGSYHCWFTLPHEPRKVRQAPAAFALQHAHMPFLLQWLEPLLLSCLGGDPRAIGRGTEHPRARCARS